MINGSFAGFGTTLLPAQTKVFFENNDTISDEREKQMN